MPRHALDVTWTPPAPIIDIGVGYPDQPSDIVERARALVDTGSDITVLPKSLFDQLALPQVGQVTVAGFDSEARPEPAFGVVITIDGCDPVAVRAIVHDDEETILGRDVLQHVKVTVDSPGGFVEVTASSPGT